MQVVNILKVSVLGLVLAWTAGCSSVGGGDAGADLSGAENGEASYSAADRARMDAEALAAEEARAAAAKAEELLNVSTFYFDFDQSTIRQESRAALQAHAAYLTQSGSNVVLEGHGDERGTREYNLALGERRAQAVARYLTVLGVSNQQIETVSYGEERPAANTQDEAAWDLNRRVELRYGN